ncbi:hypothetical protein KTQ42_04240|uniref:hypothetical protein n=1 Tax=Noviherbaspirillum sp. L7-7A TaxID=2850560 RepID=UPI001C2C57D1|nr:hypothetical protein [Noviherbaspirillum sp. L7-7A]MBV0878508.1 hypothetical protein [Noviherbaspirillum sp. L7-7A]
MHGLGCSLLLASLLCACTQTGLHASEPVSETPQGGALQNLPVVAEPRGIVGEFCSPVLAAKGVC